MANTLDESNSTPLGALMGGELSSIRIGDLWARDAQFCAHAAYLDLLGVCANRPVDTTAGARAALDVVSGNLNPQLDANADISGLRYTTFTAPSKLWCCVDKVGVKAECEFIEIALFQATSADAALMFTFRSNGNIIFQMFLGNCANSVIPRSSSRNFLQLHKYRNEAP